MTQTHQPDKYLADMMASWPNHFENEADAETPITYVPCAAERVMRVCYGFLPSNKTIVSNKVAMEFVKMLQYRSLTTGANGVVFVFADNSAIMSNKNMDILYPRWNGA